MYRMRGLFQEKNVRFAKIFSMRICRVTSRLFSIHFIAGCNYRVEVYVVRNPELIAMIRCQVDKSFFIFQSVTVSMYFLNSDCSMSI